MTTCKRILLIGDNSRAPNWGCQATTQCLKQLVAEHYPGAIISSLYHADYTPRVVYRAALISRIPLAHFAPGIVKRMIRNIASRVFSGTKLSHLVVSSRHVEEDILPRTVEEFDQLAEDVLSGKGRTKELGLLKEADIIIVNGEGSIYPGSVYARYPLFLMYIAKKYLDKPCGYFNHSIKVGEEEIAEMVRLVYPLLDRVVVREPVSLRELRRLGVSCPVEVAPDAAFLLEPDPSWMPPPEMSRNINFAEDYLCVSTAASIWYDGVDRTAEWESLVRRLQRVVPQVVLATTDNMEICIFKRIAATTGCAVVDVDIATRDAVNLLARASIYVSGRYHPSIFAAVSGTPFIPISSNSYKIEGLVELLEYPLRVFPAMRVGDLVEEIACETMEALRRRSQLSDHLRAHADALRPQTHRQVEF